MALHNLWTAPNHPGGSEKTVGDFLKNLIRGSPEKLFLEAVPGKKTSFRKVLLPPLQIFCG